MSGRTRVPAPGRVVALLVAALLALLLAACGPSDAATDDDDLFRGRTAAGTARSGLLSVDDLPGGGYRRYATRSSLDGVAGRGAATCAALLQGATSPVDDDAPTAGLLPASADFAFSLSGHGVFGPYLTQHVARMASAGDAKKAVTRIAALAEACRNWDGESWNGTHGHLTVTSVAAPHVGDHSARLHVRAVAEGGISIHLTTDVIAIQVGPLVTVLNHTRFDGRSDELRLGTVAVIASFRLDHLT